MIRRGDDDGIDILAIQQRAKIFVLLAAWDGSFVFALGVAFFDELHGVLPPFGDHVADGDDLHVRIIGKPMHMAATHHSHADKAQIDALVRAAPGAPQASEESSAGPQKPAPSAARTNRRRAMDVFRVMQHSFRDMRSSQRNWCWAIGRSF